MLPLKKFRPEPVPAPATASANADSEQALQNLAQRTSQILLSAALGAGERRAAFETLRAVAVAASGVVSSYARIHFGAAIEDAARVAALGLAEADEKLTRFDGLETDEISTLRDARHKVYLSIMTLRQTRARVDSVHPPLWSALVPNRGARVALAAVRARFSLRSANEPDEDTFQLFVVASEFESIRCQSWVAELSPGPRRRLSELATTLGAPLNGDERPRDRLLSARRILEDVIEDLSAEPDQRSSDERMLETLVRELSERRSDGKLHDRVAAVLRSLRGCDRDLDDLALLFEDGACPPWALLLQRATDLLMQHFRGPR